MLLGSRLVGHFKRSIPHDLRHTARTDALRASVDGLVRAVGRGDTNTLEVGLKLAARDAGDLGTDTAEVFFLTAGRHGVAHLGAFATHFTLTGHDIWSYYDLYELDLSDGGILKGAAPA